MAGIGFELRKILNRDTLLSDIGAFSLAGVISSGTWVISIFGILILGVLVSFVPAYYIAVTKFQISITYLIATSLIFSGLAQHSFTRYIADQLFLHKTAKVIPNLNGMMLMLTLFSGVLALLVITFLFPQESVLYRFLLMGCFVILCNIWVTTNLLAGLKDYKLILLAFTIGYGITLGFGYCLRSYGLEGFMFSFLLGQAVLLLILHITLYQYYRTDHLIEFDFLRRKNIYLSLIITSFCYNLGIWIDKFIFWYTPSTSHAVLGPLRGSLIYDVPIFLAYLALIPGMAIFLLRVETDFAEYYHRFYNAIRHGQTLAHIQLMRDKMVSTAQNAIQEIIKMQLLVLMVVFLFGDRILVFLHISVIYKNLLFIDVVGTSLQVIFLAILNILFYLDRRKDALWLCVWFVVLNAIFTTLSIYLGPLYYGYGFTFALVIVCAYGMHLLNYEFTDLDYKAIMLRQ